MESDDFETYLAFVISKRGDIIDGLVDDEFTPEQNIRLLTEFGFMIETEKKALIDAI
jgi:hypothetical protein